MRRWAAAIVLCCAGCTNAPLAGFLDLVNPSHISRDSEPLRRADNDPLGPVVVPPSPGGRLLPPVSAPGSPRNDGGFAPPLAPLNPSTTAPPAGIQPFTLPNT